MLGPLLKADSPGNETARIAGMMCGTSVDSIDTAICDISRTTDSDRWKTDVLYFGEVPVEPRLRQRIFRLFDNGEQGLSLATSLNTEIAEAFAGALKTTLQQSGIPKESVTAIASHGQTVWHIAPHMASSEYVPSTLQLGDPCVLAHHTGIPVIADFRTADMAAGGNGAPLVPFADWHLFGRPGNAVILLNLGGVANVTLLPASDRVEEIVAFDTGPGNMIIDAIVSITTQGRRTFDENGQMAAAGQIIESLLFRWMNEPYIRLPYPKTTGRELFGMRFTQAALSDYPDANPCDLVATATLFTARSVAENLRSWLETDGRGVSEMAVAGGGAMNPVLMRMLENEMARVSGRSIRVCLPDDMMPFQAKSRECVAFALLGFAGLVGVPSNVPSATGAQCAKRLGCIAWP